MRLILIILLASPLFLFGTNTGPAAFAVTRPASRSTQSLDQTPNEVGFDSPRWHIYDDKGRTEEYLGQKSLYIRSGFAFLNDVDFEDGTIEVDMAMTNRTSFVGILFRVSSADEYEIVYFRPFKSGKPDAVQYTPAFNGSMPWQLYSGDGYTSSVEIPHEQWVHVKLEIRGRTLSVYFNNSAKPVLVNDDLKHGLSHGAIGLWGIVNGGHFANFRYQLARPTNTAAAPKRAFDNGVLAKWQLSDAFDSDRKDPEKLPSSQELSVMHWQSVEPETPGMVVIDRYRKGPNRVHDFLDPQEKRGPRLGRKFVFARTAVYSERDQIKRMSIGYSDDVAVFLNGQPVFVGKSAYQYRDPGFLGIMDVENDSVYLNLKKGRNDIVLAVAEYFGGWGFICRIDDPHGIRF